MTTSTGVPAAGVAAGADGPVWHTLSADRVLEAEEVASAVRRSAR